MSDASQGPGWWQASDGKWYPPDQGGGAAPVGGPPIGAPAGGAAATYDGRYGPLAEWPQRVIAYLVDFAIPVIVIIIASAISITLALLLDVLAIAWGFYLGYLNGQTGQTPGKKLLGLKVVSEENGQVIGGGQGVVRYLCHILDGICLIGYLFPLWDPKKQTFADKIIKTVVVTGLPKQDFGPDLFKA